MTRTLVGIAILLAFGAFVAYTATQHVGTRCEVCMEFQGRTICESARAATEEEALMQARSSACARMTSGVTEIVRCTGMQPTTSSCEQ